ncbi:hypothetical protein [Staphylococcus delphini]|uniref:Phage protein n=1 Tax=Staphylococcus delphini TaxID=53344 RepID=A0AAX0QUV7_9STAP|nr:hypothetical protein [Staphylococcus delphini]PCF50094.1 hypothetical protein B5C07_07760 [Staphylococcus delphini]PNZ95715.1 hypothetical protein CD148_03300 [Staphylococcus delphini]RIZ56274.1 hypothetical protein CDL68_01665 [Staphylococcus delphini]VED62506.1 Uncharacterised protein [Staphylococcus delphini]
MKVYQPCYYNGEYYEDHIELESNYVYTNIAKAIKEIESYKAFNMGGREYKYNRLFDDFKMYKNLVFPATSNHSIKLREDFSLDIQKDGYAFIKVYELNTEVLM